MARNAAHRSYDSVAWFYEPTARWYTFGQIGASKAWQIQFLEAGDKVLYAGVGTGEDAVLAVRAGAVVTCVDPSSKMLQRAQRRIEAEGLTAEFICEDINAVEPDGSYDVVAANYFFPLFDEATMGGVMDHLVAMLKPGGRMMVADWLPQRGSGWKAAVQKFHRVFANWLYWVAGMAHLGDIREYPDYLEAAGLEVKHLEEFTLSRWGPKSFWSMVAQLPDTPRDP